MPRKNVRVEIPIKSAGKMKELVEMAIAYHLQLGNASPLLGVVDMVLLQTQLDLSTTSRHDGNLQHALAEAQMQNAYNAMGKGVGQSIITEGTLYHLMGLVRDRLLFVYVGKEEEIELWGFNVVLSKSRGKTIVAVDIPVNNILGMQELASGILERHLQLGNASPLLNEVDMASFETLLTAYIAFRKEAKIAHAQGETLIEKANKAMGTATSQTSNTPDTVYYLITRVRDRLLFVYNGFEEELSNFGFNVVVTSSGSDGSGGGNPPIPTAVIVAAVKMNVLKQIGIDFIGTDGKTVTIDWGDGTTTVVILQSGSYANYTHNYAAPGNYTIRISGYVTDIIELRMIDSNISAINIPQEVNLRALVINNNMLTSLAILAAFTNLLFLFANNNELDQQSINSILIMIESFGTSNGQILLQGGNNAAPSGQGIAAMNQLIARGWTVTTN